MGNKLTLPKKKYEYGYDLAYELAAGQLAKIVNIEQQCLKSGAQYIDSSKVVLEYLNELYSISLPDAEVSLLSGGETPVRDKLLILHYFIQAKGTPLSNHVITYKELKDGVNYFPVFHKRAIRPLVNFFGKEPQKLIDVTASLGGRKAEYGDASVTLNAFPRVPVTLVLWRGDEEFAPDGNVMFDSTVSDYLTNDDIHALCEILAWKLVKLLKAGGDYPDKRRS